MNRFNNITKPLMWLMALLMAALVAGCGDGSSAPILGGGGAGVPRVGIDTTRPRVTFTVPANAASGVPANSKITATFSEAMAPATISNTTFTLAQSGVPVTGLGVTYTVGSKTADFKPSVNLTVGRVYTATVTTGATDLAGNALAGISTAPTVANNHVWTFTAGATDTTPPLITLTNPASGVTAVPINSTVNATFNEAMDPSTISNATFKVAQSGVPAGTTISGTSSYDAPSMVATFKPSSNLTPSTTYIATITNGATDLAGNALVVPAVGLPDNPWVFTTGAGVLALGAVDLGSASTFGLMATAAVTAASASVINGDVSLEPGTSVTGFPPAVINGALHINDTVSHQARNDLLAAYNYAKGLACTTNVTAALGSMYVYPAGIPPGVYCSGSTMLVNVGAPIVLDGGGDANAVWVFQIGSSMTSDADVTLRNGAQAKNVFWVPTSDMTIGSGTTFNGTIVAGRDSTSAGFATINGRILTGAITAGTIALNGTPSTVNVPAP